MDVEGPSLNWGTPVQVWDCSWDDRRILDNQKFIVVKTRVGYFNNRWQVATTDESLCFSESSCDRWDELIAIREELLDRHHLPGAFYLLDHDGVGRVLNDIAHLPGYSTTEKVFVWNSIANQNLKNASDLYPYYFDILADGAHRLVINADWLGRHNTRAHTIVPFWDGYHGYMVDFTPQDAFNMIWKKENNAKSKLACAPFCPNLGDVSASLRTVIAMQAFQRTNDFRTFSSYWNGLQRESGRDWCPDPIYSDGCAWVGMPALQ